jgi:hypothetical protein
MRRIKRDHQSPFSGVSQSIPHGCRQTIQEVLCVSAQKVQNLHALT